MKKANIITLLLVFFMVLSTSVFASEMNTEEDSYGNEVNQDSEVTMLRAATMFRDKGGWGEFGSGMLHAWAKYTHPTQTHRVVLVVDNSYHYGAYELAGELNYSYVEATTGHYISAYGDLQY